MDLTCQLKIIPLGGFGEIGLNCLVLERKRSIDDLFGIDVVIPFFNYVLQNKQKLKAIVITHGHEDHLGALPWLLPYVNVPVYGSKFTLGI